MAYTIVLSLHSILRWVVVILALLLIIRAANGLSFKRGWTQQDDKISLWFTSSIDVQLLLGLILYFFLSPVTTAAMQNFGGAMSQSAVRFFAVEHAFAMFIALVVAHVGRAMIKKGANAAAKHRRAIIWTGLTILVILAAVPWPFYGQVGRPLLRFFGL